MYVMAEEDGLIVVVRTTSHTVCYANAEESHFMYREKDTAVLNALQIQRGILILALLSLSGRDGSLL